MIKDEFSSTKLCQTFDINYENKAFSVEIYFGESEKTESIHFKAYEKSSISKFIFINAFNLNQLINMSKVFKICDNFKEAFALILQKFKDKEVVLFLDDDLDIIIDFPLPNKKTDKVKFVLSKQKLKDSELMDKLYANIAFLQ